MFKKVIVAEKKVTWNDIANHMTLSVLYLGDVHTYVYILEEVMPSNSIVNINQEHNNYILIKYNKSSSYNTITSFKHRK